MRTERGFTLIELLVVIAILALLFGTTALALNGVYDSDSVQGDVAEAEADVVQTAIDVCELQSGCTGLTGGNSCYQPDPASSTYGFEDYLRRTTKFYFTWEDTGSVTAAYEEPDCSGTALWSD